MRYFPKIAGFWWTRAMYETTTNHSLHALNKRIMELEKKLK